MTDVDYEQFLFRNPLRVRNEELQKMSQLPSLCPCVTSRELVYGFS
jgi:hypothetical protein